MQNKDRNALARRLLFAEAFQAQIKTNLGKIKSNKRKQLVTSHVLGDKQILKKYKVSNEVKNIETFRCARYSSTKNCIRRRKQAALSALIKNDIQQFFEEDENTRVAPGKKDCITRKKQIKTKTVLE